MANPDHLKILKGGVAAWNNWRKQDNIVPDLSNANFVNEELDGINFDYVRLHSVMFNAAKLKGASFIGARVLGSCFAGANLASADFTHTHLDYVSFNSAYLVQANFFKAELAYTSFANAKLSEAINLDTCLHLAPSSVDLNTLRRSGLLPEKFLKGCGMPHKFVSSIASYIEETNKSPSCFISYSGRDEPFARHLRERMIEAGIQAWFAPENLRGGEKLHEQLFHAIQSHDRLLIVLSEHSIKSEWVITEIREARRAEKNEKRRKLFPIRLCDFKTLCDWSCFDADSGKDLAVEVREYFIPDFSSWKSNDDFRLAFEQLKRDLRDDRT